MPLDAITLGYTVRELRELLPGSKIDKIYQPTRDQVVFQLRSRGGNMRLLLSANPGAPRIHFSTAPVENPAAPPMFCMLLRKHLVGGRIEAIEQPPMERVVDLRLSCTDEFGEPAVKHVILEIMGRNSNLILTGEDGHIIDCVRRVDYEMSQQRQVLPGLYYHLPPTQDKLNPEAAALVDISALLETVHSPTRPDAFLMEHFSGLPPLICRELCFRYNPALEDLNLLSLDARYQFAVWLKREFGTLSVAGKPYLLKKNGSPWDYCYMPITQYGSLVICEEQDGFSPLLDQFYAKRDAAARMKSKSQATHKTVQNLRNRTARKLKNQEKELAATTDRDTLRIKGELITANLYRMERGQRILKAENYYDPELNILEIALDPTLSPQQNAAKYFKEYTKAKNAVLYLTEQLEKGRTELSYLDSILDELNRAESEKDLQEIRKELISGGYIRNTDKRKQMKSAPSKPMEFRSSAGLQIRVGRNNVQNDLLTLKSSYKSDLWFHTQKIHGSHVILSCNGEAPDEQSILEAAQLAAYYSQARDGQNIPVDYCPVKQVKKPAGAKPGMVVYEHYHTLYVNPDSILVQV